MKATLIGLFLLVGTLSWSQTTGSGPTVLENGPTVNPQNLSGVLIANQFPGSDIGAQINNAFSTCVGACKVFVPSGNYTYTTTINFPVVNNGFDILTCGGATLLNYTGGGDAIGVIGAGNPQINFKIEDCKIIGTSAAVSGLHIKALNRGTISHLGISGFTSGDGVFIEGANSLSFYEVNLVGNYNGVHNKGFGSTFPTANANHFFGGQIGNNTQWGFFEDATGGASSGNGFFGVTFEDNGRNTPGGPVGGQVFVQSAFSDVFEGSYFEEDTVLANAEIVLGDATHAAYGTVISGNVFGSGGANTVNIVNSLMTVVEGNEEVGTPTNFVNNGSSARGTHVGKNQATDAANYAAGSDFGADTYVLGNSGFINAQNVTPTGYGFNSITGNTQDLVIRTRSGGANVAVFQNTGGATVGHIDNSGDLVLSGWISKSGGGFKIDHPLDPANKYLEHSFVESPDMMNVYNGITVLNAKGESEVALPDYFSALNRDFRYQLTAIGEFAPLYVAREISDNKFAIAGGKPGLKVSWQVTGVRKDPYAEAIRFEPEGDKPPQERGHYLHPELYRNSPAKK
jgi:hypothetical protein